MTSCLLSLALGALSLICAALILVIWGLSTLDIERNDRKKQ